MKTQPLIAGIIIVGIGYGLKYFGIIKNQNICWGIIGLGILIFIIGLFMKKSRKESPEEYFERSKKLPKESL